MLRHREHSKPSQVWQSLMDNLLPFLISQDQISKRIRPAVTIVWSLHAVVRHLSNVQEATETLSSLKLTRSFTINCNRKVLLQMAATSSIKLCLLGRAKTQTYLMQSNRLVASRGLAIQRRLSKLQATRVIRMSLRGKDLAHASSISSLALIQTRFMFCRPAQAI